jgi:hypothetical protein
VQKHLRPRTIESKIACVDPERFGDACAGSPEEKEQGPVSTATTCSLIRRINEGIKFLPGEVVRHLSMRLLDRDGENALRDAE